MKLAAYYNRSNIVITLAVLLIGAVVYYFTVNYIIDKQLDRDLSEELAELEANVSAHHQLPDRSDNEEERVTFAETGSQNFKTIFYDTVFKQNTADNDNGRAVKTLMRLDGKSYLLTVTISRESTESLVQVIALINILLMAGLFVVLFLTNRYVSNDLWRPFFYLLRQLKAFNVSEDTNVKLNSHKIDEFNELEVAINLMALRVKKDYDTLKQFTENASHEMMTPLSVITSKLDILIQDGTLDPQHYKQIQDIYSATSKLSRLNRSLLLLVKVENGFIEEAEQVALDEVLLEKVEQFQELTTSKHIAVFTDLQPCSVMVSKHLLDILLNNLFSNAVRHNTDHGALYVTLTGEGMLIQNTGVMYSLPKEDMFKRFQKGKRSEGTGLGLALVQSICRASHWQVSYYFDGTLHCFEIKFDQRDIV